MDVMFYEAFKEEEKELRSFLSEDLKAEFTSQTIQEAGHAHPRAKIISIRTQSQIPHNWSDQMAGVLSRSQGYDHLQEYKKQTQTQARLGFLPAYCSRAVAEHAIMVMFNLLRKAKKQAAQFETFNRDGMTGRQCLNKRVLVVGVGHIGSQIAYLCSSLGMMVSGVDLEPKDHGIKHVSLKSGLKKSDVIFCALPLTEETQGMLDYQTLKEVNKDAVLVNISRGEITPIEDMKQLLDEKILSGLAMDVFPYESDLVNRLRGQSQTSDRSCRVILELNKRPNAVFTPHNAFNTQESLTEKSKLSVRSIESFLSKGSFLEEIK